MTETDSKTDETSTEEVAPAESEGAAVSNVEVEAEVGAETEVGAEAGAQGDGPGPEAHDTGPEGVGAGAGADAGADADAGAGADAGADADAGAGADAGTDAGADTVSGEVVAAEAVADTLSGSEAPAAGKKKRRRRRKKKGAGASEAPGDSKAPHHHAPFLHLFAGAARKHAFSVGEVIAGTVQKIEHGAIVVDLFGKASAIADADEPRDVPIVIHEPEPPAATQTEAEPRAADHGSRASGQDDQAGPRDSDPGPEAPGPGPEDTGADADTAAGTDAAAGTGADAAAGADAGTEADADAGTEADADAGTEADSAAASGADTGAAAGTETAAASEPSVASTWEYDTTDVTDLPEDLGEADTVVAAPAYDGTLPPAHGEPEAEAGGGTESVSGWVSAPAPEAVPATAPVPAAETAPASASVPASAPASAPAPETASEAPPAEPKEDLSDADMSLLEPLPEQEAPQVGAIFRGRIGAVAESGHIAIVNRVIDKAAVRKAIRAAREQHQRVTGVVYGFNRGGFDVLVGGVRAFCPASAMSLTPIEDPTEFVGQRCEFSLPQDKGGKKSIIVSRRNILEKEARKRARERMAELEVGTKLKGKVLEVRDYGVLVDLGGGLDGLVHMSEVSWSRGVRPHDAAKVGDEVEVAVIKVQQATRKDRYGRVSLSMRACQPDPWEEAKDTLRPGTPVKGKVVRTTDFGAFVELQENIEGLLHISELGGSKELTHAKQAVTEGDEIHVVVERVDKEQRRISLSKLSEADAKAIEAGEIEVGKAPRSLKPGTHIAVIVKRVEHGGAQVQVEGMLGKRGRGFIPNRELQDHRGEKRKGPSQGDVIDVKIIGTERDGTLRCSIRARLLDEERKAVREYRKESAKQGLGTFGDLLKAKLGGESD